MPRKFKQPLMTRYVLMIGLGLAVTACTPRVANRGNNPDAENLAEIKTGESNRQDVAEIIGAPTLTSSLTRRNGITSASAPNGKPGSSRISRSAR